LRLEINADTDQGDLDGKKGGTMPPKSAVGIATSPLLSKLAIAKVSEDLVSSPVLRASFIKDPAKFIQAQYGHAPNGAEKAYFADLQKKFADGLCCGGCACSPGRLTTGER
jgi:hypothetical protein